MGYTLLACYHSCLSLLTFLFTVGWSWSGMAFKLWVESLHCLVWILLRFSGWWYYTPPVNKGVHSFPLSLVYSVIVYIVCCFSIIFDCNTGLSQYHCHVMCDLRCQIPTNWQTKVNEQAVNLLYWVWLVQPHSHFCRPLHWAGHTSRLDGLSDRQDRCKTLILVIVCLKWDTSQHWIKGTLRKCYLLK